MARKGEIFALDVLPGTQDGVLLAGGRCGQLCMADLRAPDAQWTSLQHTSSIAHIKAIDAHHVLAAGPKHAMVIYDTRYLRESPAGGGGKDRSNQTSPVLSFPEYKNASCMHIGLDVLRGHAYGHGLVAAAHDDGKVALFSIRDGRRLKAPAIDAIDVRRRPMVRDGPDYLRSDNIVRCLAFKTMPGDQHASLCVAEGKGIYRYAFTKGGEDW